MPGSAAKIQVTEKQRHLLDEISRSRSYPRGTIQRATIVLLGLKGLSNQEIAVLVQLERQQVGVWRRRWRDAWVNLCEWENREPHRLREAILQVLTDAPRLGRPGTFTAEQVAQIIALACEDPGLSGRPISQWTQRELCDEVVKRKIVISISVAQIGRFLLEASMQPHRSKMWLTTTQKDPEKFREEVERVCQTYQEAAAKSAIDGTHTVSVDEATALQAIERNAPDKPVQPGLIARLEFEYTRHGTTTLTAGLDVVTGRIVSPTMEPTRTEPEFVQHIIRTVNTDPDAHWTFIVDCLNTHCSATLVRWVAKVCQLDLYLGSKKHTGILKNMKTRKEFLSDPTHRIRFVFLPKHSSWLNQIEVFFGILHKKLIRKGNFTSVEHLQSMIAQFIEYFNHTMARPYKWTYTGKPIEKKPRSLFVPPHRRPKFQAEFNTNRTLVS
jgi:transposase